MFEETRAQRPDRIETLEIIELAAAHLVEIIKHKITLTRTREPNAPAFDLWNKLEYPLLAANTRNRFLVCEGKQVKEISRLDDQAGMSDLTSTLLASIMLVVPEIVEAIDATPDHSSLASGLSTIFWKPATNASMSSSDAVSSEKAWRAPLPSTSF